MKFDPRTVSVIKNFGSINSSMLFRPGKVLSTVAVSKTILARATVETEFPKEFAIYDLSRFLNVMSLLDNPDIDIGERDISLSNGRSKIRYVCAAPNLILSPKTDQIKLPSEDIQLTITSDMFAQFSKAASILGLPEMVIEGDGKTLRIMGADSANRVQDAYSLDIGETDKTFHIVFKLENLKLLPEDYNVTVSREHIAHFKGNNIEYWITPDAKMSRYE